MIKQEVVLKFLKEQTDKPAIIEGNKIISWKEFSNLSAHLVSELSRILSAHESNTTLFISKNSSELILLGSAFSTLGIPFHGIDYHLSISFIQSIIRTLNVKNIFISEEFKKTFSILSRKVNVYTIEDFFQNIEQYKAPSESLSLPVPKFKDYDFTSGTTGSPKVVYRSFNSEKKRNNFLKEKYLFNEQDIYLCCLPMYHMDSMHWLKFFLNIGATIVIHNYKNKYYLCETIHEHKISAAFISPIMLRQMVSAIGENEGSAYFEKLRFILTGGKGCSISLKQEAIQKLGPIIYEYYGTTETGMNTLIEPAETLIHPGSVGKPLDGVDILILDNRNEPVTAGIVGRIAIHSDMNMDRYLNEKTEFFYRNGQKYITTSDYGYKNAMDYLFITKTTRGFTEKTYNVFGLENEILNLPYVLDVSIKEHGENIKIDIVPKHYHPYQNLKNNIEKITENHGIAAIQINIVSRLDYTLMGKIKSYSHFKEHLNKVSHFFERPLFLKGA